MEKYGICAFSWCRRHFDGQKLHGESFLIYKKGFLGLTRRYLEFVPLDHTDDGVLMADRVCVRLRRGAKNGSKFSTISHAQAIIEDMNLNPQKYMYDSEKFRVIFID